MLVFVLYGNQNKTKLMEKERFIGIFNYSYPSREITSCLAPTTQLQMKWLND